MCDTMVAMNTVTEDGSILFAKNSDREPNEAQNVTFVPAMNHKENSQVRCTYIAIPQVKKTYALILSRPFWMFGAEMGVNENGVVIGNEAVFTKEKYQKNDVLTGMDLLRLALERSRNAAEAKDIIIDLIGQYGQGGNCSMEGKLYYHNSFIIADYMSAFVVETAGTHWAVKKVSTVASISNCLTLGDEYQECSSGLKHAGRHGGINFRDKLGDKIITHFAGGVTRQESSYAELTKCRGKINTGYMMRILRTHGVKGDYINGKKPMKNICMHAGGLVSSQTTGSMVVKLLKGRLPLIYVTGTSAPCLSIFKPLVLAPKQTSIITNRYSADRNGAVELYGDATKVYDPSTLWWQNEEIHRRILVDYPGNINRWLDLLGNQENAMIERVEKLWSSGKKDQIPKSVAKENARILEALYKAYEEFNKGYVPKNKRMTCVASLQWKKWNRKAGLRLY